MAQRNSGGFIELVKTLVYAGLIALVIRTFLFEPFSIPSGSMIPTLLVGDYLFVSKYAYGYSRHSFPLSPPLFEGRIFATPPERGDVAVFKLPSDQSTDYIKRVIGLPGDRVQMIQGILHINGEPVPREFVGPYMDRYAPDGYGKFRKYEETLDNGRRHNIIELSDSHRSAGNLYSLDECEHHLPDETCEFVVMKDHFLAMGDNRDNSSDSRYRSVGQIPFENLVGRAEIIFFSVDGSFLRVWEWLDTVRGGRLFKTID